MLVFFITLMFGSTQITFAQLPEPVPLSTVGEQQLEAITEASEDAEIEDDAFLQAMRQFAKNPINLNTADGEQLKELLILTPLQIERIISYRRLLGDFIHLYELQAVPGLDLATIEKLRPYITVSLAQPLMASVRERMKNGRSTLLVRVAQVVEEQQGFLPQARRSSNHYPGSRQRMYFRYKYQFKNLLQYGVLGEKDAGEQFFKGVQKMGFDFYSAHLFARSLGVIKSLAIGDFTVNFGQGLTQWQSLAFRKGAEITSVKRQLQGLRPYNSAGENNFHRGAGVTIQARSLEATVFVSLKKVDGNLVPDTLFENGVISSLQTSGLHRTAAEIADKGSQGQFTTGGNISYTVQNLKLGLNAIHYRFSEPIKKAPELYNLYALSGRDFGNYSVDYSYSFKNLHFFGEAAVTGKFHSAIVNGVIISLDAKTDLSILHRSISKAYQSLYTNAFTENSYPTNEKGIFAGLTLRPAHAWRLDGYVDIYKFPWVKFLVDAPSTGVDAMFQLNYKRSKRFEMYLRYRGETKAKNSRDESLNTTPVIAKCRQNLRVHANYKLNPAITVRGRLELISFDKKGPDEASGLLVYADALVKPMTKPFAASLRLQYFGTDSYNSRLYAYENDVLYSSAVPVFYDKGLRYYLNFNYDVSKKLGLWFRWAQTRYFNKASIGSGLDEISGSHKTEIKLQLMYEFD